MQAGQWGCRACGLEDPWPLPLESRAQSALDKVFFHPIAGEDEVVMSKDLVEFIKKVQSEKKYSTFDAAAIKQGIVLKLLSILDWDPFDIDEVYPQYESKHGMTDFSLRHKGGNRVFISVEMAEKNFDKAEKRLLEFAEAEDVPMAVVTDGLTWWFTLALEKGKLEERRFCTLAINEESPQDAAKRFADFLSKDNVVAQKALKSAEAIYQANRRDRLVQETLPKAWEKLLSEPEKWLTDVLSETTQELSGFKPEREVVREFVSSRINAKEDLSALTKEKLAEKPAEEPAPAAPRPPVRTSGPGEDFTGQTIAGFRLAGKRYEVRTWKDMLLKLCELMAASQKDGFEYVVNLASGDTKFFSKNSHELLTPEKVPGTNMHVEVNLGATGIVGLCSKVILLFGYKNKDLIIETKQP